MIGEIASRDLIYDHLGGAACCSVVTFDELAALCCTATNCWIHVVVSGSIPDAAYSRMGLTSVV